MHVDPRPIVHIGYHKTGTTWFQKTFYPSTTSHRFIPRKVVHEALLVPNGLSFDAGKSRAMILEAAGGMPPLLCEERLSGSFLVGGLHGMMPPEVARRIKAIFPDARIVIGIRAQPSMLAACYSQHVKMGGTVGVPRFLFPDSYFFAGSEFRCNAPRFDLALFEYQQLIGYYCSLFGDEVHIVPFEEFRKGPLECGRRLSERLGFTFNEAGITANVRNPSLTRGALMVVRFLNLFTARRVREKSYILHIPYLYEARKLLFKPLNAIFPGRGTTEQLLGRNRVRWLEARFAAANRDLAAMTGLDLAALGYPMAGPSTPPPAPLPRWRKLRAT